MTASMEDLIRTTMTLTAEEARPVNLTPRIFAAARKRRTVRLALAGATVAAAIALGAPLTFAATGGGQSNPGPPPAGNQPAPSPSSPQPVPAPSLSHQFACPAESTDPASPCYGVRVPSPAR